MLAYVLLLNRVVMYCGRQLSSDALIFAVWFFLCIYLFLTGTTKNVIEVRFPIQFGDQLLCRLLSACFVYKTLDFSFMVTLTSLDRLVAWLSG